MTDTNILFGPAGPVMMNEIITQPSLMDAASSHIDKDVDRMVRFPRTVASSSSNTTIVLDMTQVDPFATIGNTMITVIHLADVFDYLQNGFRVVPYKDKTISSQCAAASCLDPEAARESEKSSEWTRNASLPNLRHKAFNTFGLPRRTTVIVPEEEAVPDTQAVILIMTGEDAVGVEKLEAVLFGDANKAGTLVTSGLITPSIKLSMIHIIPAFCCCPMPSVSRRVPLSSPQHAAMQSNSLSPVISRPCVHHNDNDDAANELTRSYSGVNFRNAVKVGRRSHCTAADEMDCHRTFHANNGPLSCLRTISSQLSQQVLYLDGTVMASKAIPMVMETSMSSPAAVTVLLKPDPRTLPFRTPSLEEDIIGYSCDQCISTDRSMDNLGRSRRHKRPGQCYCRCVRNKETYLGYFERAALVHKLVSDDNHAMQGGFGKGSNNMSAGRLMSLLPLDSNKEPIEEWRSDTVWGHVNSCNDLPRMPWSVPMGQNEITYPEKRRLPTIFGKASMDEEIGFSTSELEWCGVALLSESVVNFWLKERIQVLDGVPTTECEVDEAISHITEGDLHFFESTSEEVSRLISNLSHVDELCTCTVREDYRSSRAQDICRSLTLAQRIRLLELVKELEDRRDPDGCSPIEKSKDRLASTPLRSMLQPKSTVMQLVTFLVGSQFDERSFAWGTKHAVEDVITGRFSRDKAFCNPDIWETMVAYEACDQYPRDVAVHCRPSVFGSHVNMVEAPMGMLVFWLDQAPYTQDCCAFMETIIHDLSSRISTPLSTTIAGLNLSQNDLVEDISSHHKKINTRDKCIMLAGYQELLLDALTAKGHFDDWMVLPFIPFFLGSCLSNGHHV